MVNNEFIFSSESVTEGHPDKVADQISDSILDEIIMNDKNSRVACETLVTTDKVIISAEISTNSNIDYEKIIRNTIIEIGYNDPSLGFDGNTCNVELYIDKQSNDISIGVDQIDNDIIGAGDQGIMFGYATNENKNLMPYPILLSHKLTKSLSDNRKNGNLKFLRPDGKSQVSIKYKNKVAQYVDTVLISTQHSEDVKEHVLKEGIIEEIIKKEVPSNLINEKTKFIINPTGRFVIGGPHGDTGLTGRKIIVDTYGGWAKHGGGAFSGKDPSKVDRSACYMARYMAKNIVASGLLNECEIQLAYAIGKPEPVSYYINSSDIDCSKKIDKILDSINQVFDCTPKGIIKNLNLLKPIYKKTASYGHFGRNESEFTWEKIDKSEIIKNL